MSSDLGHISAHRYGKDLVRVARVVRENVDGKEVHHFIEYTVRALIDGQIETSYTKADNTVVVPTDTCKNTVNYFAKTSPYVMDPAAFALHLATHFVSRYPHINKSYIDLTTHRWSRIQVEGKPHKWAFYRDGDEKQTVSCTVDGTAGKNKLKAELKCGLKDLLVLKTSGSAFEDFWRDELTTLVAVKDRIFSTSVTANYTIKLPEVVSMSQVHSIAKSLDFPTIAQCVRTATLEIFATDESASVQATLYKTGQKVLELCPAVKDISYALPNKHYVPVNLSAFGQDNGLGYDGGAEVFYPASDPSGWIEGTVTRNKAKL